MCEQALTKMQMNAFFLLIIFHVVSCVHVCSLDTRTNVHTSLSHHHTCYTHTFDLFSSISSFILCRQTVSHTVCLVKGHFLFSSKVQSFWFNFVDQNMTSDFLVSQNINKSSGAHFLDKKYVRWQFSARSKAQTFSTETA